MNKLDHPPEWPDKVMFAAMLVIIAGALGAVFALLRLAGATIGNRVASIFLMTPPLVSLALCALMVGLGLYAIRHQASVWVWLAVGAGVVSMEMLGLVPFLSLVAVAFLFMSRAEGEETTHDDRTVDASLWPDKALAASLLIFVASVVSVFQAGLLFADNLTAPVLPDNPTAVAFLGLAAGVWGFYAAHEVFHVRRAWTGYAAGALGVLAFGLYVVGPALSVAAIVLLMKASGEDEFVEAGSAA